MRCWLGLVAAMMLLGGCSTGKPAAQAACYRDMVQTSPGLYIFTAGGRIFQAYPTNNQISMMWRPLDRLVICPTGGAGVEMTNLTENGQKVKAVQIYIFG